MIDFQGFIAVYHTIIDGKDQLNLQLITEEIIFLEDLVNLHSIEFFPQAYAKPENIPSLMASIVMLLDFF